MGGRAGQLTQYGSLETRSEQTRQLGYNVLKEIADKICNISGLTAQLIYNRSLETMS